MFGRDPQPLDPASPRGQQLATDLSDLLADLELNVRTRREAALIAQHDEREIA